MRVITPLCFVHTGYDYYICANRIRYIIPPDSAIGRRHTKAAKTEGRYQDFTYGRATKSLLIMDDGTVVACAFSTSNIADRIGRELSQPLEPEPEMPVVNT